MRIAVNTRFLQKKDMEGVGRFTYEVLKRMVADHPEDEFIFFFDRNYDESFIFGENVKPVVLFPPARHPFLFIWWFQFSITKALKKYKPDVFLSPDNFCSLLTSVPTVLVIHDLAWLHFPEQVPRSHRWFYETYTPRFVKKADRIVTVSEFTKEDILTHFPVPDSKIDVACNGCDDSFRPLSDKEIQAVRDEFTFGKPYFIYVGAIHPRKNIGRLLWSFQKFKDVTQSSAKLVIAGRKAWMTKAIEEAYRNSPYKNDIVFTGYLEHEKLPLLMGAATALVYISLFEGFGIPLLEAMQAEVPIIASNVSSLPEVAGKAAVYVNATYVKEISKAMQQVYDTQELRESLVERGREQRKKFSWERAADTVYKNILMAAKSES